MSSKKDKTVEELLEQLDITISDGLYRHRKAQGDKFVIMFPLQIRLNDDEGDGSIVSVIAPSLSEVEMFLNLRTDTKFFKSHAEAFEWLEKNIEVATKLED